uniref:Uncharacterized protein n=1 Tax=Fopius arisanus TaxID=64838 RepID=A0A0C9QL57_9HYME
MDICEFVGFDKIERNNCSDIKKISTQIIFASISCVACWNGEYEFQHYSVNRFDFNVFVNKRRGWWIIYNTRGIEIDGWRCPLVGFGSSNVQTETEICWSRTNYEVIFG